jgi:hypothetical protein
MLPLSLPDGKFLEHVIVELFDIIDCDLFQNTKAVDNVLVEKLLDYRGAYVGDMLCLNPFGKILNYYEGKGVIALSWS